MKFSRIFIIYQHLQRSFAEICLKIREILIEKGIHAWSILIPPSRRGSSFAEKPSSAQEPAASHLHRPAQQPRDGLPREQRPRPKEGAGPC